jgi:cytochrome c oxidase subunit 1
MATAHSEHHEHGHHEAHSHHHHREHFLTKYIFSQDHKMIARQFLLTAIVMAVLAMMMSVFFRMQLAWPNESFDMLNMFLGDKWAPNGVLDKNMYLALVTIHGTIMVFFCSHRRIIGYILQSFNSIANRST